MGNIYKLFFNLFLKFMSQIEYQQHLSETSVKILFIDKMLITYI